MAISFSSRLPSNQQAHDLYWSGDPAFVQGKGEEYDRKVERARETGDWSPLLIEGQTPTKFVARQIPGELRRRLYDRLNGDKIGPTELDALTVRLAITDVVNLGDFDLKFVRLEDWGRVATSDLPNALDQYAPGAVADLAAQIYARLNGVSGK